MKKIVFVSMLVFNLFTSNVFCMEWQEGQANLLECFNHVMTPIYMTRVICARVETGYPRLMRDIREALDQFDKNPNCFLQDEVKIRVLLGNIQALFDLILEIECSKQAELKMFAHFVKCFVIKFVLYCLFVRRDLIGEDLIEESLQIIKPILKICKICNKVADLSEPQKILLLNLLQE